MEFLPFFLFRVGGWCLFMFSISLSLSAFHDHLNESFVKTKKWNYFSRNIFQRTSEINLKFVDKIEDFNDSCSSVIFERNITKGKILSQEVFLIKKNTKMLNAFQLNRHNRKEKKNKHEKEFFLKTIFLYLDLITLLSLNN